MIEPRSQNSLPRGEWRLLRTPSTHGAWNMAVDEAILEAQGAGEAPPTLRLYAWEPPCLSLGYAQPFADVDLPALQRRGWEVVRRPTGGRAILHTDELTYAVIGPLDEPRLAGSLLESYQRLSAALLAALHRLALPAEAQANTQAAEGANRQGPVCFEVPSNYEITVGGKKLVGSAQARRKEGVLQHGSLPLTGDLARIVQALCFANEPSREQAAERVRRRAATVEEALGRKVSWEQAAHAFENAFAEILNLELRPSGLTEQEERRAARLVGEKYAHPSWTERL